jgi:hypothetical protein
MGCNGSALQAQEAKDKERCRNRKWSRFMKARIALPLVVLAAWVMLKSCQRLAAACTAAALVALLGLSPAKAVTDYQFNVDFTILSAPLSTPQPIITLTGSIVTNCDACDLTQSNIVSYDFYFESPAFVTGGEISSSNEPVFGTPSLSLTGTSPLIAINSQIFFAPGAIRDQYGTNAGNVYFQQGFQNYSLGFESLDAGACVPNCGDVNLQGPGPVAGGPESELGVLPVLGTDLLSIADLMCTSDSASNGEPSCLKAPTPGTAKYEDRKLVVDGTPYLFNGLDLVPAPTPLPDALPLFATGLGVMGLFGWRRKRKAQASA